MIIIKLDGVEFGFEFGIFDSPPKDACIVSSGEYKNRVSYAALHNDQIVGALTVIRSRSGKTVSSCGTVVRSSYRKDGIGRDIWRAMLKSEKPKRVQTKVTSDRGYSLVESMKEEFPKIKWLVDEVAGRKLRRMSYK